MSAGRRRTFALVGVLDPQLVYGNCSNTNVDPHPNPVTPVERSHDSLGFDATTLDTQCSLINDMSETTQILFNSPALHSLKRDQLVKLCKIHSIKASGKNVDLIQKLRDHASTLPPDDPLRVAVHTDSQDGLKRPSDQWEIVMEDIPEVPEPSRTTLSSLRSVASNAPDEFGTGGGSKCEPVIALNLFLF